MPPTLKVTGLPGKSLAYTNRAYVNTNDQHNGRFIQVAASSDAATMQSRAQVYFTEGRDDIAPGCLGLNVLQRRAVGLSNDDQALVSVFSVPPGSSLVGLKMKFEVDLLINRPTPPINADNLAETLKSNFSRQVMCREGQFAMDFEGTKVRFVCRSIEIPNAKAEEQKEPIADITQFSSRGMLTPDTVVQIDAAPGHMRALQLEQSGGAGANAAIFGPNWNFKELGIGGLDDEFAAIFRRSFASRLFPPKIINQLGVKHVKGMLLWGPPGTGKTLIARQIGKLLAGREPKIVNGPEILNKYVGQAEENIRKLFEDAEAEWAEKKDSSGLHIIIFDEIDAICKVRGSVRSGTGVHDTVVNQLLSKIDGVDTTNNFLVIGMTNRKDMIDPALLRPGRLEVHVEIGLPDQKGRVQIFNIHTRKMRENGLLSPDVDIVELAERTKNFSGAEIEGLVKSAASYSLYPKVDIDSGDLQQQVLASSKDRQIIVTMEHFHMALSEVKPAFGVAEDALAPMLRGEMISWGEPYTNMVNTLQKLVHQVKTSPQTQMLTVLLEGPGGTGKTALAASVARDSEFPFLKVISPEMYVGFASDTNKCNEIQKVFEDSYKSPLSMIFIDDIERLLEYVPIGPRFSNPTLQALLVLLARVPPVETNKLMIIATSSHPDVLEDMDLKSAFNVCLRSPSLTKPEEVEKVFREMDAKVSPEDLQSIAHQITPFPVGIKPLQLVVEMARQSEDGSISPQRFRDCLLAAGLRPADGVLGGRV